MLGVFKEVHRRAVPPVAGARAANTTQQIADLRFETRREAEGSTKVRQGETTTYQALC